LAAERGRIQAPRLSKNLRLVELLRDWQRAWGDPGVVAVAWTLHHPAITRPLWEDAAESSWKE